MQQNDEVVSGWLSGSDSVDGRDNPAGPLYIHGAIATEDAMTGADASTRVFFTFGGTTASCEPKGCDCC